MRKPGIKHGYNAWPNFRSHRKRAKLDCRECSILNSVMKALHVHINELEIIESNRISTQIESHEFSLPLNLRFTLQHCFSICMLGKLFCCVFSKSSFSERGTCIKRLFWPPYEVKDKSCSSQVPLY